MNKDLFYNVVKPLTMTSKERIETLFKALEYLRLNEIEGDIVECGVWKGGNILGIMEYCKYFDYTNINVWAYDTFNGMTPPTDKDIKWNGSPASQILDSVMCFCPLNEFEQNIKKSKFPKQNLKIIKGDVLETLENKNNLPNKISLLRLDTDWYESTKKELEVLYPLIQKGGVLIIDDYGHWKGAKEATDQYFLSLNIKPNFRKIDYTAVYHLKKK